MSLAALVAFAAMAPPMPQPIVIAHRGYSGLRPEHTLEAYQLAMDSGADYVEPDLVPTKDGVLIARHENELSDSTDVADRPEFADRKTTKVVDGQRVEGWFSEDFTLAEVKTLFARERLPKDRPRSARFNDRFRVPTLQEVLDLVRRHRERTGRTVGVYPETKHPTYFRSLGLPLEPQLVSVLHRNGYRGRSAPVFIQSFEVGNLMLLRKMTDLRLVQLLSDSGGPFDLGDQGPTYRQMASPEGLSKIATYADGIGPNKNLLIPRKPDGSLGEPTTLARDARAAGLKVHAWTFRNEARFLPADLAGRPEAEVRAFAALGIDGMFTDFPGTMRRALAR